MGQEQEFLRVDGVHSRQSRRLLLPLLLIAQTSHVPCISTPRSAGDDMDLVMSKLKDEMYEDLDLSCDVVSGLFHDLGFKTLSFKQALGGLEPFVYTCTTSNKKKARV
mmetsp:Transcript_33167/g.104889  ORF Transcript_33167/g.104889 Transcript_33167/m.104889 type:complete len:108 (-) Transcript_33167:1215-1538(-)